MADTRNDSAADIGNTMSMLRLDAAERGMHGLAIVYGWSSVRLFGLALIAEAKREGDR